MRFPQCSPWLGVRVLLALWTLSAGQVFGQEKKERKDDEKSVRKTAEVFAAAFKKGDHNAIAAMWTDDGEYVSSTGKRLRGRKEIAKAFAEHFKNNKERSLKLHIDSVRFLGKNTAIEEGVMMTKLPSDAWVSTRYSVLHVREGSKWQIAAVREWEELPPESKLTDIEWMVGNWVAKKKETEIHLSYRWNKSKTYINGTMTVKEGKKVLSTARIVLGHDPVQDIVRSWVFHDDGSYGHGAWYKDGGSWAVDSASKLADGSETSAVNIITPISKNAFAWRSIDRIVDGELLPNTTPVRVQRVGAEK